MAEFRHHKTRDLSPIELGLSGVTLASQRTSNTIDPQGYSHLAVYADLTGQSAATDVQVVIEFQPNGSSNWHPVGTESISSGTITLSNGTWTFSVSGTDQVPVINTPIHGRKFRIKVDGTSGGASDVVSVYARLTTQ